MALPPESEYRGVAAAISQPATAEGIRTLQDHISGLTLYNAQGSSIQYRDPTGDQDIVEAVYRWDDRDYRTIFRGGFTPRDPGSTTWDDYYNLERHVNGGGAPGDTSPAEGTVFISATRSTSWRPSVSSDMILYRYEIFAPGGIDTVLTLGDHHDFPNQQEIAFAGGINHQYIRSARPYSVFAPEPPSQFPRYVPYQNRIYRNGRFNPNPDWSGPTTQDFMNRLRNVVCPRDDNYMINIFSIPSKRDVVGSPTDDEEPYNDPVCKVGHYVDCAFNINYTEEAFVFTADQCLQINYAPGTTNDYIIRGPLSIGDFFPSLQNTIFATGIDAAFTATDKDHVYMFRSNLYVNFNFATGEIIGGPKKITDGFYSLKNTIFEHGIDAAFASHKKDDAYIFKGDQYALINFAPGTTKDYLLNPPQKITDGFPSLRGTVFADGLDSGFRAEADDEAYIFKDDTYARINYAPGTTRDYIMNKVSPISDGFHSLKGIIPRYSCGC